MTMPVPQWIMVPVNTELVAYLRVDSIIGIRQTTFVDQPTEILISNGSTVLCIEDPETTLKKIHEIMMQSLPIGATSQAMHL